MAGVGFTKRCGARFSRVLSTASYRGPARGKESTGPSGKDVERKGKEGAGTFNQRTLGVQVRDELSSRLQSTADKCDLFAHLGGAVKR